LADDSIGHCKRRSNEHVCDCEGCRDVVVSLSKPKSARFLFVGLDEEQSLQKKRGYTRRIARSQFGYCCQHNKREDQRTKRDFRTRVAKCTEVDCGILEHLL
jgi:hypothetical protein